MKYRKRPTAPAKRHAWSLGAHRLCRNTGCPWLGRPSPGERNLSQYSRDGGRTWTSLKSPPKCEGSR